MSNYPSSRPEEGPDSAELEFSLAHYEPMARLLSQEDYAFLRAQPGFRPEIARKFAAERRRIFRLYLDELTLDFNRLHRHARGMVASLPADHSMLIGILIRTQLRFWYEMAAIEVRLSLSWAGAWAGLGSLDVRNLLNVLGSMHAEIGRLSAPSVA